MIKICLLVFFCVDLVIAMADEETRNCGGVPGIPGLHGSPGRDGRDGAKGERGETGRGERGEKGESGEKGSIGKVGEKGEAGQQGIVGPKGNSGNVGERGEMGPKGIKGDNGSRGSKGEQGVAVQANWKQCAWNRADAKDTGVIQECQFSKRSGNSALRVAYAGTLRVLCSSNSACCSRWYFTFNGNECSGPMTIDGIVYSEKYKDDVHRHRQIEGYCENIPAGKINIAFHVGNCAKWRSGTYDAYTGWYTTSRIMIEETAPAQQ